MASRTNRMTRTTTAAQIPLVRVCPRPEFDAGVPEEGCGAGVTGADGDSGVVDVGWADGVGPASVIGAPERGGIVTDGPWGPARHGDSLTVPRTPPCDAPPADVRQADVRREHGPPPRA